MNRVDANLGLVHLVERVLEGLDGTLDVSLDDEVELLDLGIGHGVEEVLKRDVLDAVLLLDTGLQGTLVGEVAGITVVLEDTELVARARDGLKAENLDRVGGPRLGDGVALRVEHRANASVGHAGDERVADVKRAAGNEDGRDGAAALVELRLEDVA